ncbi:MAG: LysR family transcriptional regulator, partial [Bryobacterales bacterium]|nr:LysR family transcriptional regulator [Bryobacterales bacterium]
MTQVKSAPIDLNLWRVLRVLLEEGSAQGAAARLGMTPSGVSRALARLRERLGDPLFVRAGNRLVPTARAQALRGTLEATLGELDALEATGPFELAATRRTLRIATADWAEALLLPGLMTELEGAPGVQLVSSPMSAHAAELLEGDQLDLIINVRASATRAGLHAQALLTDGFCC